MERGRKGEIVGLARPCLVQSTEKRKMMMKKELKMTMIEAVKVRVVCFLAGTGSLAFCSHFLQHTRKPSKVTRNQVNDTRCRENMATL